MRKLFLFFTLLFVAKLSADCDYETIPYFSEHGSISCQCGCVTDLYLSIGSGALFPSKNSSSKADSNSHLLPSSLGTSLFTLPNVVWKNKYQTGFEVNGALGFVLKSNCRVEAEFLYQNFKRKINGSFDWSEVNPATIQVFAHNSGNPLHHASSKTNIYSLLSNICFDYKNSSPWSLYLGGGVGVAWINSHNTKHNGLLHIVTTVPPLDESSPTLEKSPKLFGTAFAWQVKFGLKYDFIECLSISLNYRLFGTTRFQASSSRIITRPGTDSELVFKIPQEEVRGLLNNSINLAVDFHF